MEKQMNRIKKYLPDVLVVLMFAAISFAYFFPADIEGKILYRHDSSAGKGIVMEGGLFKEKTGKTPRWTNSAFSGMPTYQIMPSYSSANGLNTAVNAYHLWLPENVWFVFVYLLGFYILLRAFDFRQWMAALGAIVWAFSSYFFIIIAAGHLWKVMALAYLPPMIAGIVLAYKGRYLWGFIVTAIFTAFEVNANHVQMTYYYLFIVLFMVIAYLVEAIRDKQMKRFAKATATCAAAALIGIGMNLSNLYHTWEYGQESMRGKSELVKANSANQTDSGLERDYITQWSYGIDETWTLLIPNTKGGASVPLTQSKIAMEHADNEFIDIYQQLGQYWGDQPMTAGPVYVGAFVFMLFILGLFIVKGPLKWALVAATVLSVLLSWGRNFKEFFEETGRQGDKETGRQDKCFYISFIFTAGVCVLFAVMPGVFFDRFVSANEMQALNQLPAEYVTPILQNLTEMRKAVFTADCWRSFWIVVIGAALMMLYRYKKLRGSYAIAAIIVLCLADMWIVNKRYLNNDMFVPKSEREMPQQKTKTDEFILQDTSDEGDFRVLNLAGNTFNENNTSYYHKSIGGYHAAKLRRYQELIDAYISPEMRGMMSAIAEAGGDMTKVSGDSIYPVLNMLNTKYIIVPLQGGETVPIQNPYTYGNAWLVDNITYVDNANEELDGLKGRDLRHSAVADKRFKDILGESTPQGDVSVVSIKSYEPDHLTYEVESDKGGVVVFSEIYYPGWTATVDGESVEVGRVNYVLRAIRVAPGRHSVELSFYPKSIVVTETIAYITSAILIVAMLVLIALRVVRRKS